MFFCNKSTPSVAAFPKQILILLCLILLVPAANAQDFGLFDSEEDFVSYSPLGAEVKTYFDDRKYVQKTSGKLNWPLLRKYYKARGYHPAWCRADDHGYSIELLLGFLEASSEEGLNPDDYEVAPNVDSCAHLSDEKMAEFDIALTNAFFKYSKDVHTGRFDPKQVDEEWHIPPVKFDPVANLETALKNNTLQEILSNLPPQHKQYKLLRQALARYREIKNNRSWPFIPTGRSLKPGTTHPHIPLIRRRLAGEMDGGLYPSGNNEQVFDNDLKIAVERFQKRHGLEKDGYIGPSTKQAMNISAEWRIKQIKTSMERWRWMPRSLGEQHILVNVPGFEMNFIKNDQPILSMRTIAGRKDRTSPSFQSKITQIIFNPTWTVPKSIAIKDLLPQQQQDPNFFYKSDIEVFMRDHGNAKYNPNNIDWSQFDEEYFPYLLVQKPGTHNSLGRIKFQTPNKHSIFMHDTPYRHLFNKRVRAFSSGCIRLEKPEQLAAMLLGKSYNPTLESAEMVGDMIGTKKTIEHDLTETVPVYLIYMTAWVDKHGVLQFRNDIYERDIKISNSLTRLDTAG